MEKVDVLKSDLQTTGGTVAFVLYHSQSLPVIWPNGHRCHSLYKWAAFKVKRSRYAHTCMWQLWALATTPCECAICVFCVALFVRCAMRACGCTYGLTLNFYNVHLLVSCGIILEVYVLRLRSSHKENYTSINHPEMWTLGTRTCSCQWFINGKASNLAYQRMAWSTYLQSNFGEQNSHFRGKEFNFNIMNRWKQSRIVLCENHNSVTWAVSVLPSHV